MSRARLPQLRLADEFFLAAHDHEAARMRPRLLPAVLGLGISGALLAELMMTGRIGQLDGYILPAGQDVRVGRHRGGGDDPVTDRIVYLISNTPGQSVSVWLGQLQHSVTDGVRERLVDVDLLQVTNARRWWGGTTVEYRATDQNIAMGPEAQVFGVVSNDRRTDISLQAAMLVGLTDATGLRAKMPVWEGTPMEVRQRMADLRYALPQPLSALLTDLEAAVGAVMLSTGHH
jgi:Golgi phosphoprotein 3 (GPP34)